jgi:hypothetical protein
VLCLSRGLWQIRRRRLESEREAKLALKLFRDRLLIGADEGDDGACRARTPSSSRTVHVGVVVLGRVVVDHTGNVVDMDASSGDIGANEHLGLPGLKHRQRAVALRLGAIPVDCYRTDSNLGELTSETLGAVLGSTEHDRGAVRERDASGEGGTSRAVDPPEVVGPRPHGVGWCIKDVATRIVLVLLDQAVHISLERRGEQERLAM